jgi:hypothetical protein
MVMLDNSSTTRDADLTQRRSTEDDDRFSTDRGGMLLAVVRTLCLVSMDTHAAGHNVCHGRTSHSDSFSKLGTELLPSRSKTNTHLLEGCGIGFDAPFNAVLGEHFVLSRLLQSGLGSLCASELELSDAFRT